MRQSRSIFPFSRTLSHVDFGIKEDRLVENLSLFCLLLVSEHQPSFLTKSLFQETCCLSIPHHIYFLSICFHCLFPKKEISLLLEEWWQTGILLIMYAQFIVHIFPLWWTSTTQTWCGQCYQKVIAGINFLSLLRQTTTILFKVVVNHNCM